MNILERIQNSPPDVQFIIYQFDDTYKHYYNKLLKEMIMNTKRWRTNFKLLPYESSDFVFRNLKDGFDDTFYTIKKRCDILNEQDILTRKRYNCKYWTYSYYYPLYEFKHLLHIEYVHDNTRDVPPSYFTC
jgi:hypothetical protein